VQSALTGHLVLSTLHTNDAASSVTRLLEMGVEDYLLTSTLRAVIAQRLVRLNCPHCSADAPPNAHEARWLDAALGERWRGQRFRRSGGCAHCNRTGYAGRTGVYEMLEMTPELARAANQSDPNAFLDAARAQLQGRTLTEGALKLVFAGRTTVAEAMKVAVELED